MGVMLLGKMKIHELAKEIDKTSKDIIAVAQELGLDVKSHMSSLEENDIEQVKKKLIGEKGENKAKKETVKKAKESKKESSPVIIRRQVIISDEEIKRKQVPGSISFVPSVAGLIIASEVVKDLI